MRRYAEDTTVSVEKSEAELKTLLRKHGAEQRLVFSDDVKGAAVVQFTLEDRMVRLKLRTFRDDLPDPALTYYGSDGPTCPRGWNGWSLKRRGEWVDGCQQQFERSAWRRLVLVVKSKLELVADGMATMEEEFLAYILLPNNSTVYEECADRLSAAYESGQVPPMLGPARG